MSKKLIGNPALVRFNILLKYMTVIYPEGAIVTATNGAVQLSAPDTSGRWTFPLASNYYDNPEWVISSTIDSSTKTKTQVIVRGIDYVVNMNPTAVYIMKNGILQDGWSYANSDKFTVNVVDNVAKFSVTPSNYDLIADYDSGASARPALYSIKLNPSGFDSTDILKIYVSMNATISSYLESPEERIIAGFFTEPSRPTYSNWYSTRRIAVDEYVKAEDIVEYESSSLSTASRTDTTFMIRFLEYVEPTDTTKFITRNGIYMYGFPNIKDIYYTY